MTDAGARRVQWTYLTLTLLTTLAASFIWGINTLFLLDAGLSNAEAFAANAFFTVGQVLFEVPTGVVADTRGRRFSFILGAATLLVSTLLYLAMWRIHGPFWGWALDRPSRAGLHVLLRRDGGLAGRRAECHRVRRQPRVGLQPGQVVSGWGDARGSVLGGVIAQVTNLGDPLHHAGGDARRHHRRGVVAHARPGLHAQRGRRVPVRAVRTVLRPAQSTGAGGIRRFAGSCSPRRSRPASASTRSTRRSRTSSSCTATRTRTASRAWRRRSWRAQIVGGLIVPWVRDLRADGRAIILASIARWAWRSSASVVFVLAALALIGSGR